MSKPIFKQGQLVECVEKPGYLDGFSRGSRYIVCRTTQSAGWNFITILGDDYRGHSLLETMFRPVTQDEGK